MPSGQTAQDVEGEPPGFAVGSRIGPTRMAHRMGRESSRSRTPIRRLQGSPRAIAAERAAGALAAKLARQDASRMAAAIRDRAKAEQQVPEPVLSAPALALAQASELVEAEGSDSDDFSSTSHSSFCSSSSSSFGDAIDATWRGGSAPARTSDASTCEAPSASGWRGGQSPVHSGGRTALQGLRTSSGRPSDWPHSGRTQTTKTPLSAS